MGKTFVVNPNPISDSHRCSASLVAITTFGLAIPIEVTAAPLSPFGVKNGPDATLLHTLIKSPISAKYGSYNVVVYSRLWLKNTAQITISTIQRPGNKMFNVHIKPNYGCIP